MNSVLSVLRSERRARWFLLTNLQSAIGTGAAAVALVVIAYDRLHSPWAITFVLLADFLPVMLIGPIFGALADRVSRRACAVAADVLRALAFIGLALVHSYALTVALAVVAGIGTALFSPAVLAALPSLAAPARRAAVTSLYGATRDIGRTLGPLAAAAAFSIAGAPTVMWVNGVTFAVSAIVLAALPFGDVRAERGEYGHRSLMREAREGLAATWRLAGVRVILWASTAMIVCAAMVNVGELLLARDIGTGTSGFALLMVAAGSGIVVGSLLGTRGGALHQLKRRYVAALALSGAAILGLAISTTFAEAMLCFLAMGIGNGIVVVHERLIFHAAVPERQMGRAFALLETLGGWGFAAAFVGGGSIIAAIGTRGMLAVAGGGALAVWVLAMVALRRVWPPEPAGAEAGSGPPPSEAPAEAAVSGRE